MSRSFAHRFSRFPCSFIHVILWCLSSWCSIIDWLSDYCMNATVSCISCPSSLVGKGMKMEEKMRTWSPGNQVFLFFMLRSGSEGTTFGPKFGPTFPKFPHLLALDWFSQWRVLMERGKQEGRNPGACSSLFVCLPASLTRPLSSLFLQLSFAGASPTLFLCWLE